MTGAERQPHVAAVADELDGDAASWLLALKRREAADAAQPAAGGPTTFQQAVAAATAAATAAASADSVPATAAAAEATATKPPGEQSERQLSVDQVWLACGSAYAASTDPVLCQLAAAAPAPLTGGYPWLDDNHLCWPGAAVYLIGRGALLSVGPCAGAVCCLVCASGHCRAVGQAGRPGSGAWRSKTVLCALSTALPQPLPPPLSPASCRRPARNAPGCRQGGCLPAAPGLRHSTRVAHCRGAAAHTPAAWLGGGRGQCQGGGQRIGPASSGGGGSAGSGWGASGGRRPSF